MPSDTVFISYSRQDAEFVKDLQKQLSKLPVQLWQDIQDLEAGSDWPSAIDDALRACKVLILVLSRDAVKSQYVNYEWAFALGRGARIIPILREPLQLHPRLQHTQGIEFWKPGKRWLRLLDALESAISGKRPTIRAAFELEDGKPKKRGRDYVILLSIEGLPRRSKSVRYEVHYKPFEEPIWEEQNPEEKFETRMWSYGDVPISAQISVPNTSHRNNKHPAYVRTAVSLFDGLRRTHGNTSNRAVKSALKYIEEH